MGQRKVWTSEEDKVLKQILEERHIKKWSRVSKIMEQYNMPGRSGKQCRERWYNQLDPGINNKAWSEGEEQILFNNHDNFGNKWARIAQDLPGRTDNAIKNHFYSTLRKSVRRLNRFIAETKQKKELREIKPLILSKIIVLSGDKVSSSSAATQEIVQKSVDIKQRLIAFAKQCEQEVLDEMKMRSLIEDIMVFNGSYKRRNYAPKKDAEEPLKIEQPKIPQPKIQEKIPFHPPKLMEPPKIKNNPPPEAQIEKPEPNRSFIQTQWCMNPNRPIRPLKLLSSSVEALLNPGYPTYKKPMESEFAALFSLQSLPVPVESLVNSQMRLGDSYTYSTKNGHHLIEGQFNMQNLSKNE